MAAITAGDQGQAVAAPPSTAVASASKPAAEGSGHGARFTAAHDACQSFMSRFQHQKKADPWAGQPSFSLGPIDIHAGSLLRRFRVRQTLDLTDRLSASAGLYYDLSGNSLAPWGSLTYRLDPDNPKSKSRLELSTLDRRLLLRKGWEFNIKNATVGVSAEARLNLVDDAAATTSAGGKGSSSSTAAPAAGVTSLGSSSSSIGGMSLRPDLHISLDHVDPLKYELIGIGLLLLLGLPLSVNNKEIEKGLPYGLGRLKGFGRASLKRAGYMQYKLGFGEATGVLDL